MRFTWIRGLAAVAAGTLLAVACGGGQSPPTSGNTLKVGAILALTGGVAIYGVPEQKAMKMAVDKLNAAGGVNGHKIELTIVDDGSLPAQGGTVARQLIDQNVAVIAGPTFLGSATAIQPIVEASKTPWIPMTGFNQPTDAAAATDFKVTPAQPLQADALMQFISSKLNVKKLAMISSDDTYGKPNRAEVEAKASSYGLTLVSDDTVAANAIDASPQAAKISPQADAVLLLAINPLSVILLKGLAQVGWSKPIIGGIGYSSPSAITPAGTIGEGMYVPAYFNIDDPNTAQQAFIKDWQSLYSDPVTFTTGWGWDSIMLIAEAVKKSGSVNQDGIQKGLSEISNYQGLSGTYTFNPTTHEMYDPKSITFTQFKGGKFQTVK
jgi:branched-chain amino acid transport system substrate-binding protein